MFAVGARNPGPEVVHPGPEVVFLSILAAMTRWQTLTDYSYSYSVVSIVQWLVFMGSLWHLTLNLRHATSKRLMIWMGFHDIATDRSNLSQDYWIFFHALTEDEEFKCNDGFIWCFIIHVLYLMGSLLHDSEQTWITLEIQYSPKAV